MKSIKYLIFTYCFLLLFNLDVYAKACDGSDISRLREIANDIEVNYVFNPDYEIGYFNDFNLEVSGITDEVYIYFDEEMNEIFNFKDSIDGNMSFGGYSSGDYKVFIASKNCGNLLREVEIKIPVFNEYSLDDRCKKSKYSNLDICDEWYEGYYNVDSTNLDYYFEGEQNNNFVGILLEFITNNVILVVLGSMVLFVILIIFVLRQRKRWSLE